MLQVKHCFKLVSVMPHNELQDYYLHVGALGSPQGAKIQPEIPDMIVTPGPYYLVQIHSLIQLPRY